MGMDTHVRRGHPITFGLIILFGVIELALSAWLTSKFNMLHNQRSLSERDRVRFTLFTSTWTIFSLGYWSSSFGTHRTALCSLVSWLISYLGFSWIMWTAAAASITEMLGGGLNCKAQDAYVYCNQLNALEGFAWLEWLLVTFAIVVVLIRGIVAARRGDGYRGGLV
ncbi:hypothetical protein B0H14DRAFT_3428654 [Mycena olivaceomarginata]|nr:hypothetical protein B0H14DRAFT_3428654 [Mycena olivaceomarginata]